jgi:hypothetical protein
MPTLAVVDRTLPRGTTQPFHVIVIRLPTGMADIEESRRRQRLLVKVLRAELGLSGREAYRRGGKYSPTVCVVEKSRYAGRRYALAEELARLASIDLGTRLATGPRRVVRARLLGGTL